ncbi:MAG: DUF2079 domain-containing protein [Nostoc sp. ChiQUE01a]|nr:DUF2079 domain-containing protein [Nostoc sp. ChiQUE01a]
MRNKLFLNWIIIASIIILFTCSAARHELFKSTAFDLGIFDQAIYLISIGQPPISSYLNFHILGDHAAFIFYPLALLYKIYPSVYWLFAIQAFALAIAALPLWYLSLQAGLKENQALAIGVSYLLYPLVFNVNLFDFHPEVITVPLFLVAVLTARSNRIWWFYISIFVVLICKAVLSLTVIAMGVWLLLFEKKRLYGTIAIITGLLWLIISTKIVIPFFGTEAASVERQLVKYSYLGSSFLEASKTLVLNPTIILENIFSLANLAYLALLTIPLIWGLSFRSLKILIAAIPCLALNILADYSAQKDLIHQYSLPILPFLMLTVISTLAAGKGWLKYKKAIILWSLITFLALAKFTYFGGRYLNSIDNWQATKQAIAQVTTKGSVYTTIQISPHLSQRKLIQVVHNNSSIIDLKTFNYILLNVRHPGLGSSTEICAKLVNQLKINQDFYLKYQQDDVYVFIKKIIS